MNVSHHTQEVNSLINVVDFIFSLSFLPFSRLNITENILFQRQTEMSGVDPYKVWVWVSQIQFWLISVFVVVSFFIIIKVRFFGCLVVALLTV